MVKDGYLIFSYYVSAEENYDYLSFYRDEEQLLRVSNQLTWKEFNVSLSKGFHKLRWVYSKDFSISRGDDLARIQYITISGLKDVNIECDLCPKGSYRNGQMKSCELCPQNTFAKNEGTERCENCPYGEESLPGATQCTPSGRACTPSDVYYTYSPCQNYVRTQTAHYIKQAQCNSTRPDSYPLPPPSQVPCDSDCQLGQELTSSGCQTCPRGKYRNGQMTQCQSCESGSAIQNENYYINQFREDEQIFTTGCNGVCKSDGWRMMGNVTDSGVGNGISTSWLQFTVDIKKSSRIYFDHSLSCNSKTGFMLIEVNGVSQRNIECSGCDESIKTTSIRVSQGTNTIRISYTTQTGYSSDYTCDRALIKKITIQNSVLASGAIDCVNCPSGSYSFNAYVCLACPGGFYSAQAATTCSECKNDTYSRPSSSFCSDCGNGFQAKISPRSKCDWISKASQFIDNNRTYEWAPLVHLMNNQLFKWNGHQLLINLDRDMMFCHGFLCILKNGTYEEASDSMSIKKVSNGLMLDFNTMNNYNQTKINMICSPNSGRDFQPEKDVTVTDQQIDIYSEFGCPLCQETDYKQIFGTCINGKRSITYQRTSLCTRGVTKTPEVLECTNTVRFQYWILIVVPLLGIIILGVIATVVIGIVLKYWRLSKDYSELLDRQRDNDVNEDTINTDQITMNNSVNPKDVILNEDHDDIDLTK